MNTSYLIITALEGELDNNKVPKEIPVVFSGVGKINATLATIKAIQEFQPKKIINFGTVGKINSKLSGLVSIQKVIQRDMLTEPLAPRGKTPFCKKPSEYFSENGTYTCGTGDSFVTSNDDWLIQQGVDVVDMELFAIAAVAHEHQIPWISFKFISDDANHNSGNDWQENISSGEELFLKELAKIY